MTDLGLDMQDIMGRHEVGAVDNITRLPVNNGDGCHFQARFRINRVCVFCRVFASNCVKFWRVIPVV